MAHFGRKVGAFCLKSFAKEGHRATVIIVTALECGKLWPVENGKQSFPHFNGTP